MMKICPECGLIMLPKKQDDKFIFVCGNGHISVGESKIKEVIKHKENKIEIATEGNINPIVKERCTKCGNDEAYNWEIQTRRSDEPATEFFKCTKCKHIWREYGNSAKT